MQRSRLAMTTALCGILALTAPVGAWAQAVPADAPPQTVAPDAATPEAPTDPARQNDEVVVTANRRAENVQRVAASISVIGGSALGRSGVTNSNELGQVVPNVTITSTFNNSNPRIFIRGVGSADFNPNAASPVGVYFDDVYLASTNAQQFQLFDVQRVEVLRGPQGTLYGRNTTAGAVKYFSNLPTDQFTATGTLRYGRFDDRFGEFALSGPLAGEALTARVAVTGDKRDGNTRNRATGERTGNDIRTWGARGLLKYAPTTDFKLLLNVHGGKASPHTVVYKPRGVLTATGATCDQAAAVALQCFDALGYRDNTDPYSVDNNRVGRERVRTIGASLQAEVNMGWATLTSITAYDRVKLNREEDSDGSPNQLLEITYASKSRQFSQELRLTSPGGRTVNWIVGGYYFNERTSFNNQYDILRSLRPVLGFDPGAFVVFADQDFRQRDEALAGFGRVDVNVTDKLKLTGGLRYTHETKRFTEAVALPEPTFTIPLFTVGDRLSNNRVTGDAIVNYQATPDLLLYGSYSRGFKSGGFNGGIVFDPQEVTSFRPETLTSYETGFKFQTSDHRLTLNASAFYYDYKDLQVYTLVNPPGGGIPIQVLDNASNARVYGLEAATSFRLLPEFRLNGSLGLLNSKFKNFVTSVTSADLSGNRLPRAPSLTASISGDADIPLTAALNLRLNADASYRSKIYFDGSNSLRLSQNGYWLANARVGLASSEGRWEVAAYAKNIFDKRYFRDIIDLSLFGFDGTTIGDPATYGIQLGFKF